MQYRRLGKSGLQVSALSFGSWVTFSNQIDLQLSKSMISLAYESGVNFFDNAEVYASGESEVLMGQAIKELGFTRDTFCVSSKVFWGGEKPTQRGLCRKHIVDACHAALRRLQVDYLDLYFCHRPDTETPVEETVRTMNHLIEQGKILYWGTSEWSAQQIMEAIAVAKEHHLIAPTMEQPQYNMFHRERFESEYSRLFSEYGLGTTIWSPLDSGLLTGKYAQGIPTDTRANLKGYGWLKDIFESPAGQTKIAKAIQLQKLAEQAGMSLTHLALAWCLKNPNVSTVILGASKEAQLKENLKAIDMVEKINENLILEVEKILDNKPAGEPQF